MNDARIVVFFNRATSKEVWARFHMFVELGNGNCSEAGAVIELPNGDVTTIAAERLRFVRMPYKCDTNSLMRLGMDLQLDRCAACIVMGMDNIRGEELGIPTEHRCVLERGHDGMHRSDLYHRNLLGGYEW